MERVKNWFRGWFDRHGQRFDNQWDCIKGQADFYGALIARSRSETYAQRMTLGSIGGVSFHTMPETQVLVMGPPRSAKTSGLVVPLVLGQGGPVVVTSTKLDVAITTGMARSRMGHCYFFSPTEATPSGFIPLRWSPVDGCSDWLEALEIGNKMMSAADGADVSSSNSRFFQERAAGLISVLLFYAANNNHDMSWVLNMSTGGRAISELVEVVEKLRNDNYAFQASLLEGILLTDRKERGGYFSTATNMLRGYYIPQLADTTRNANFIPSEFVKGRTDFATDLWCNGQNVVGQYDTVYICAPPDSAVGPIVVGLLTAIRRAAIKQHRHDVFNAIKRLPVSFILDELATIAPIRDLAAWLAFSGEGTLTAAAIQDFGQAKAQWPKDWESFMSLFQTVMLIAGTRHSGTAEMATALIGKYDRPIARPGDFPTWQVTDRVSPDVVHEGNGNPDSALTFLPGGKWNWVTLMPYYRDQFWSWVLVNSAAHVVQQSSHPSNLFPLPDLVRYGTNQLFRIGGQGVIDLWRQIESAHKRRK